MNSVIVAAAVLPVLYLVNSIFCLVRNVRVAKKLGISVVCSPISPFNPAWIIFNKRVVPFLQRLPFGLGDWTRCNTLDWTWIDRAHGDRQIHKRHGDTFANVTPRGIEIHTRDQAVVNQVLRKYTNEFPKLGSFAKVMDVIGTSVVSSDGADWAHHRKATVATLNDRNNGLVWAETIRQTRQMARYYSKVSQGRIVDAVEDIRELYLHVFTYVCYGVKYEFKQPAHTTIPAGHSRSYKECLHSSINGILMLRLVPWWMMGMPGMPSRIRNFRQAILELQEYLDEMISSCQERLAQGQVEKEGENLLSFMVRRSKESQDQPKTKADNHLSESEIRGNLFTYARGGHESSAHTLTFMLYLLAAMPEVQEWLMQEIKEVLVGDDIWWQSEEAFLGVFARLKRCQAAVNETLRLYPSVIVIPKTNPLPATLRVGHGEIHVPSGTNLYVNMPGVQVHEGTWGPNAMTWDPRRWVDTPVAAGDISDSLATERLLPPPDGAFVPWSEGKRACPGKRFSQVGLVAALATILAFHKVEVIPNDGESAEAARGRTLAAVNNTYAVMSVHMYQPYSVRVKMVQRKC
ncbi:cytochrome P450 [Colletotrichum graminicola]|uniref:Cytochrome P450 n=1 Tax=Colletotrichum graminicola (strain M1.001 / M2 / FGSC 10212) TaxID=645133 RepID=E3R0U4_COLGM|nr:cytochrome P450 [Colletotrichum graminicola M1.001]EFQ36732.1 cytochrome P450 [Colletotrichum graminicola M1.001]WDK19631.1 cytochrome P450 [Colletotrichum graminicola]